jgi:hypothetical protein
MQNFSKLSALFASAFLLSACEPAFETTAQKCVADPFLDIPILVVIDQAPAYQVLADDQTEYMLYAREAREVLQPDTSAPPLADRDTLIAFLDTQIEQYFSYVIQGGAVLEARNPIDFLENIIHTTDKNTEIESFSIAKRLVAEAIEADDGFCDFETDNIRLIDDQTNTVAFAKFVLTYNPFDREVRQQIISSELKEDLNNLSSASQQTVPFISGASTGAEKYKAIGFPDFEQRLISTNNTEGFAAFDFIYNKPLFSEDFFELRYLDQFCNVSTETNNTFDWDDCSNGETPRTPQRSECAGEANKVAVNTFNLNATYPNAKRFRAEVDYSDPVAPKIRFYASNFNSAIEDENGNIVTDPTNCEKSAVLAARSIKEGRNITEQISVLDPNFDNEYDTDANGNLIADANGDFIIKTPAEPIIPEYIGTASAIR